MDLQPEAVEWSREGTGTFLLGSPVAAFFAKLASGRFAMKCGPPGATP